MKKKAEEGFKKTEKAVKQYHLSVWYIGQRETHTTTIKMNMMR